LKEAADYPALYLELKLLCFAYDKVKARTVVLYGHVLKLTPKRSYQITLQVFTEY